MECVAIGDCPYIVETLQELIDEAPSWSKKKEAQKNQYDAIETLSCGDKIDEKVCCAKAKAGKNKN